MLSMWTGGAIALTFPSSLSLSDVEEENREQLSPGGQSQPSDCISRQKVAVLIPHRNREKHLLFLLHYLHPFLQRQQSEKLPHNHSTA